MNYKKFNNNGVNIGKYNEIDIIVTNGKYGPYLKYNKSNYSIPKCFLDKTGTITLNSAIKIIDYKNEKLLEKKQDDESKKQDDFID
jgi:topoisomerase IA-like protein